jgi:hypothetical protein
MRYWKGQTGTVKEGQCGTYEDNGTVPDSIEIKQEEYNGWKLTNMVPSNKEVLILKNRSTGITETFEVIRA